MFWKYFAKAKKEREPTSSLTACGVKKQECNTTSNQTEVISISEILEKVEKDPSLSCLFLGMGCFFGAELHLSSIPGVIRTRVGKATATNAIDASGSTVVDLVPLEVVEVLFDPQKVSMETLLVSFFENHHCFLDPEVYTPKHVRSCVFITTEDQVAKAKTIRSTYQEMSVDLLNIPLSTVIGRMDEFELAEAGLQQYFKKHPGAIERKRPNALFGRRKNKAIGTY